MSGFNNSGSGEPVSSIKAFPGEIPAGWLECNGAAISRAAYAKLFLAIGETYGAGDGATTFNLPDLRGEFIRGLDAGRGVDAGRVLGSGQADEFKSHTHEGGIQSGASITSASGLVFARAATNPAGGDETRPRNVAMRYGIKY